MVPMLSLYSDEETEALEDAVMEHAHLVPHFPYQPV